MLLRFISPFYVTLLRQSGLFRPSRRRLQPGPHGHHARLPSCSSRQCYLFVMANFIANEILPIAMGYPAGWFVCSALTLLYHRSVDLSRSRLVEAEASCT